MSSWVYAFDCHNVRLDKDFPKNSPPTLEPLAPTKNKASYKTMSSIPVQNQDLGICYAYSAAQMIDAVRHKRQLEKGYTPDNIVSSPVFLAINTKNAWDKQGLYYKKNGDPHFPFEGGLLCDAFDTAKMLGTCTKDNLEVFFDRNKLNEETFFEKLLEIEEKLVKKNSAIYSKMLEQKKQIWEPPSIDADQTYNMTYSVRQNADKIATMHFKEEAAICVHNAMDELYDEFKNVFGDAFKINKVLFETLFSVDMFDNTEELSTIFNVICPAHKRKGVYTNSYCRTYSGKDAKASKKSYPFTSTILDKLEKTSLPIGIAYCSKVFKKNSSYKGVSLSSTGSVILKKKNDGTDDCGAHSSLVIGSRWNKKSNSCELLVRNTWGEQCSSYKKYYPTKTALKRKSKGGPVNQFDVKCEDGNIWVDYKDLEKNTFRVEHL